MVHETCMIVYMKASNLDCCSTKKLGIGWDDGPWHPAAGRWCWNRFHVIFWFVVLNRLFSYSPDVCIYVQHVWAKFRMIIPKYPQVICFRVAQPQKSVSFGVQYLCPSPYFTASLLRKPQWSAAVEWYWICRPVGICAAQRSCGC